MLQKCFMDETTDSFLEHFFFKVSYGGLYLE